MYILHLSFSLSFTLSFSLSFHTRSSHSSSHPFVVLFHPSGLVWVLFYLEILSTGLYLSKRPRWPRDSRLWWGRQGFVKHSREAKLQPAHRLQLQISPSPHTPQASLGPPQIWPGPCSENEWIREDAVRAQGFSSLASSRTELSHSSKSPR